MKKEVREIVERANKALGSNSSRGTLPYCKWLERKLIKAEKKLKNCNLQSVIARLSLKEIENMVQLLHSDDWEYGNSEERCEELKEATRNKIGYSKSDLAAL